MIADSIHNDVMAAKSKPEELDELFETITFNIKEKAARKLRFNLNFRT